MLRPQPKNNGIEIPKKLQPDLREEVLYHVSFFIMNSAFNISSFSGTLLCTNIEQQEILIINL